MEIRQNDRVNEAARLQPEPQHVLQLTNRKLMTLTGVEEVTAYDEYSVTLKTPYGTLVIGGNGLRVRQISAESGDVRIEGEIEYLQYQGKKKGEKEDGFLKRLLR